METRSVRLAGPRMRSRRARGRVLAEASELDVSRTAVDYLVDSISAALSPTWLAIPSWLSGLMYLARALPSQGWWALP